ncbi:hypothetical protein BDB01DRAFT_487842 [Pilobolus umbonatus]|nr:hypothetical protein BDB01DRAFT_487842 [Pilobolus umbonatus]
MIYRLKTRLALADFKRQHGYEKYDLYTLESSLIKTTNHKKNEPTSVRHRYYPVVISKNKLSKGHVMSTHRPYRTAINKSMLFSPTSHLRSPLSAKRSTSPCPSDAIEEDAANILVMLHNRRQDRSSLCI